MSDFVKVFTCWTLLCLAAHASGGKHVQANGQVFFQMKTDPSEYYVFKKKEKSTSSTDPHRKGRSRGGPRGVTFTVPGGSAMELLTEQYTPPGQIPREREQRTHLTARSEEKQKKKLDPSIPQPRVGPFQLSGEHAPSEFPKR